MDLMGRIFLVAFMSFLIGSGAALIFRSALAAIAGALAGFLISSSIIGATGSAEINPDEYRMVAYYKAEYCRAAPAIDRMMTDGMVSRSEYDSLNKTVYSLNVEDARSSLIGSKSKRCPSR